MKQLTTIIVLALFCIGLSAGNAATNNVNKNDKKNKKASKIETIQITNNIWGCVLAKSTRQQVIDSLKAKGYNVDTTKYGDIVAVENTVMKFGNFVWNYVYFRFEDDLLMDLWFYTNNFELYNSTLAQYNFIKAKLDTKYAEIYDKNARFINAVKLDSYTDNTSRLNLILISNQDSHSFTIICNYTDLKLAEKSSKKGLNEL